MLVSLSTIFYPEQAAVLQNILDGLAELDVRVVAATGPCVDPADLRTGPNVQIHRHLDHAETMPAASLLIGHGGHATTLRAVAHGLPSLVLPLDTHLDHRMIGQAVQTAGAYSLPAPSPRRSAPPFARFSPKARTNAPPPPSERASAPTTARPTPSRRSRPCSSPDPRPPRPRPPRWIRADHERRVRTDRTRWLEIMPRGPPRRSCRRRGGHNPTARTGWRPSAALAAPACGSNGWSTGSERSVVDGDPQYPAAEPHDQREAGVRVVHDVRDELLGHDHRVLDGLFVEAPVSRAGRAGNDGSPG